MAGEALVASCMVKWFFGMQRCEQPPLPIPLLGLCASRQAFAKQNYRALWVMICPFVLYSRWLEAESTPLPLSSIPMHIGKRWLFLPYSCFQGREARGVTLPAEGWRGGGSLFARSHSGLWPKRPDSNARHVHGQRGDGIFTPIIQCGCAREQHHFPTCQFSRGHQRQLGCIRHVPSKTSAPLSKTSDPVSHRLGAWTYQTAIITGGKLGGCFDFLAKLQDSHSAHFWSQLLTLLH